MNRRISIVLRIALALALSLVVGRSVLRGQRGRRERNRIPVASRVLASVKSLNCSFVSSASAAWERGELQAEAKKLPSAATLRIFDIDTDEGSAAIDGGPFRASDHVTAKLAGGTLHFVDIRLDGALGLLTVFAAESHDGRLQAVYSRASHVESPFGPPQPPTMSQFYGDCEIGGR